MNSYFLVLYDVDDNYIRDFDSILECADYFGITKQSVSDWLCQKSIKFKKYKLFKKKNNSPAS